MTGGFQTKQPEFTPLLKKIVEQMAPILAQNLAHRLLQKQMIHLIISNICTLGEEIIPLLSQSIPMLVNQLPFEQLDSTI